MKKLFATYYGGSLWLVSASRISDYPNTTVVGEGVSLPAAYLDYFRKLERIVERSKAFQAEERRCIDAVLKLLNKPEIDRFERAGVQVITEPEPVKRWWQFWK